MIWFSFVPAFGILLRGCSTHFSPSLGSSNRPKTEKVYFLYRIHPRSELPSKAVIQDTGQDREVIWLALICLVGCHQTIAAIDVHCPRQSTNSFLIRHRVTLVEYDDFYRAPVIEKFQPTDFLTSQ